MIHCSQAPAKRAQAAEVARKGAAHALLVLIAPGDETAVARIREVATRLVPLAVPEDGDPSGVRRSAATLTPRQSEIARGVMRGLSNKAIARELGISHFTVRNHMTKLFQMLAIQSRAQLASQAAVLKPFEASDACASQSRTKNHDTRI